MNWEICIEICESYLNHDNNEDVLVIYAISLVENHNQANLAKFFSLKDKLREYDYKSQDNALIVHNLFMHQFFFADSLELLYRYAIKEENKQMRVVYFSTCIKYSQEENNLNLLQEFEVVMAGTFVRYEYEFDHKAHFVELNNKNLENTLFKKFIDCRKGGIIIVNRPITNQEDIITIKRIMNKYLYLYDLILYEVENNPHSGIGITSFKFESTEPEAINRTLQTLFGNEGTATKINREEAINMYYDNKLSLTDLTVRLFQNDFITCYHFLIAHKNGINTIPLRHNIPFQDAEYVIDFSSLVMLFQLSKTHNVIFPHKFILSSYIIERIKIQLNKHKSDIQAKLSLSITSSKITPHFLSTDALNNDINYLTDLLLWIEKNCQAEISTNLIDNIRQFNLQDLERYFIDCVINTFLLTLNNPNRRLITDDFVYFNFKLLSKGNIQSTEFYTKTIISTDDIITYEFLQNKYLGFSVNTQQLNSEYEKKIRSQDNRYDICITNLPYINDPIIAIKHIKYILVNSLTTSIEQKLIITEILINLLKFFDFKQSELVRNELIRECRLLGHKLDVVIEAFDDAFLILDRSN